MSVRASLSAFILLAAAILLSSCSATYLARYVLLGPPDSEDYQRFPYRTIQNGPPVFHYQRSPEQERLFSLMSRSIEHAYKGAIRSASLDELLETSGTTAFIVIRDDTILYERYFQGHDRSSIVASFSVTKAFVSALIGAALAEGYLKDINEPLTSYMPELRGKGFEKVTIRHLLIMSSGIKYDGGIFPWSDKPKAYYWPDLRQLAVSLSLEGEPGRYFHYNNYHPFLLGMVLERATGRLVSRYLEEKIWMPLGMEYPALWSLDSEEKGFEKMGTGINARAIDFAKLGSLYLNKGRWNGRQVIPEAWVVASTANGPSDLRGKGYYTRYYDALWGPFFKSDGEYYQYFWWGYMKETGYDFFAMGNLGQFIYVCPEKRAVIVRFGKEWGPVDWWPGVLKDLANRL